MLPRTSTVSFAAAHEVAPTAPAPERAAKLDWRRFEGGILFAVVALGTLGSWCAGTLLLQSWVLA
jgi:hypothetical protein